MDLDDDDDAGETARTATTRALLWRTAFPSPCVQLILPARKRDRSKTRILLVRDRSVDLVEYDPALEALYRVATTVSFPCGIGTAQALGDPRIVRNGSQGDQLLTQMPSVVLVLHDSRIVYLRVVDTVDGSVKFDYIQFPLLASDEPLHDIRRSLAIEPSARALAVSGADGPITVIALSTRTTRTADAGGITESSLSIPLETSVINMTFLVAPAEENIIALVAIVVRKDSRLGISTYIWDTNAPSTLGQRKDSIRRLGSEHGLPSLLIPLKTPLHFMLVCDRLLAIYRLHTDGNLVQVHAVSLFNELGGNLDESEGPSNTSAKPPWVNWARPVRRQAWPHEALYLAREDGHLMYVVMKASSADLRIAEHSDAGKLDMTVGSAFAILDIPQAGLENGALPNDGDVGKYTTGYSDAFIGAGVHSDGGLYEIGVRNGMDTVMSTYDPLTFTRADAHRPQKRQTIRNWAPLHSMVRMEDHRPRPSASDRLFVPDVRNALDRSLLLANRTRSITTDRIFGACGRSPFGSIAECRFGMEASLRDGILFPSERLELQGASNVYALFVHGRLPYFIVSYPWKSVWCSIETVPPNDSPAYLEHLPELDAPSQTLAAAVVVTTAEDRDHQGRNISNGGDSIRTAVQVTDSEIINVRFNPSEGKLCKVSTPLCEKPNAAAIHTETGMILCILPSTSGCGLKLYQYDGKELQSNKIKHIDFTCTAATLLQPEATSYGTMDILLGTAAGSVEHLEMTSEGQMQRKKPILELKSEDRGIGIESLCTVRLQGASDVVIAGRRNGSVVVIRLNRSDLAEEEPSILQLGGEPVSVIGTLNRRKKVLAMSSNHLFAVDISNTAIGGHTGISEVFFTTPFDPTFRQGLLAAACVAEDALSDYFAGRLIGLTQGGFLCGVLDHLPKPLPIRTPVEGTPGLLISATDLKLLVYASTINHVDEDDGIRYPISTVFCMDPPSTQSQIKLEEGVTDRLAFQLSPGEEAQCLAEMSMYTREGKRSFILVGCSVLHEIDTDRGPRTVKGGSILWLKTSTDSAGSRRISCSKRSEERGPVTALVATDPHAFVYASGRKLQARFWNNETKRWPMQELQELPSMIVAITPGDRRLLYVTTAEHSTFVLQWGPGTVITTCGLVAVSENPRKGLAHLVLPSNQPLVLSSSSDHIVTGFTYTFPPPLDSTQTNGVPATFEARLPVAVNQLIRANTRPQHKRHQPKYVQDRDIIGTSLDGSLFSFSILEDNAYLLLKLVESLCHRHARICPLATRAERQRPLEADSENPQELSSNGDTLVELVERRDAEMVLGEMLDGPLVRGYSGSRPRDYERVEDRRRVAELLMKGLEEDGEADVDVDGGGVRRRSLEWRILEYLRVVLDIPF